MTRVNLPPGVAGADTALMAQEGGEDTIAEVDADAQELQLEGIGEYPGADHTHLGDNDSFLDPSGSQFKALCPGQLMQGGIAARRIHPPKAPDEGLTSAGAVAQLIAANEKSVIDIAVKAYHAICSDRNSFLSEGELDDIKYRLLPPYRKGKQQPVVIVEHFLPGGETFKVVLKRDGHDTPAMQASHAVLKKILPRIYFEISDIVGIEYVEGLELGPYCAALQEDSALIGQLVDDAFEIIDGCYREGLFLSDVSFTGGHNVMFDTATRRFRVFDIHAVSESEKDYERKFLDTLNDEARHFATRNALGPLPEFLMRLIQRYFAANPSRPLASISKEMLSLDRGSPEYEASLRDVRKNFPYLCRDAQAQPEIRAEVRGLWGLDEELKRAALGNDTEAFTRWLIEKQFRVTSLLSKP